MDQHKLFQPIHKNGWSSDLVSFNDGPPPHAFEPSQLSFAHPRKFMPFLFKVAHYLFVFDIIKPLEANSLRSGPLFRCTNSFDEQTANRSKHMGETNNTIVIFTNG